jgi:tubulysin polyketide synthase-like protein
MTISDILNELEKRGIDIELAGENIRLHGSEDDLDESLVESIRTLKTEIITFLSSEAGTDLKGGPIWCIECSHGGYRTSEEDTESLWCNPANQAVLDMQKCIHGYWTKNEKGWPVTLQ